MTHGKSLDAVRSGEIALIAAPSQCLTPKDGEPHVLLAVDQLMANLGGGERALWRLAALLPEHGFRVSILTLAADSGSPILRDPPCPIYLLPLKRTWDWTALRAALALRRFLKRERVQLVQTYFESSDLWVGTVAKTVHGVRLVWSRRDMGILRESKHRAAYRLLSRMPDIVFAVSEQVRQHCIEVDGVKPERVRTIYNGVPASAFTDPTALRPDSPTPQTVQVLAVGNIRRVKGHDVLLEAAAIVRRRFPEVEFAVAGEVSEPEYFASLLRRREELGLADRFHFLGGVSPLNEVLWKAAVFAMPSRSEGFSNAILEAMAASLPVVATAVGGNAEAVADGVTGLLVPPDDPEALAEALCRLLEDPVSARKMGSAGRQRALDRFTEGSVMRATVRCYRDLLRS